MFPNTPIGRHCSYSMACISGVLSCTITASPQTTTLLDSAERADAAAAEPGADAGGVKEVFAGIIPISSPAVNFSWQMEHSSPMPNPEDEVPYPVAKTDTIRTAFATDRSDLQMPGFEPAVHMGGKTGTSCVTAIATREEMWPPWLSRSYCVRGWEVRHLQTSPWRPDAFAAAKLRLL